MEEKKLTYEELEALVKKYSQELEGYKGLNNQLYQQLMGANMANLYKRLDYLFKVVDTNYICFDSEFVSKCAEEIMQIMTPPEEPETKE